MSASYEVVWNQAMETQAIRDAQRAAVAPQRAPDTTPTRVQRFLEAHPDQTFTVRELSKALDVVPHLMNTTLYNLARAGMVVKQSRPTVRRFARRTVNAYALRRSEG